MPRAGISVQHTACTRRAARRRVLARAFCAQFPLRASLAPSAHALTSHGVLLTLQVESCTSPWLCTLLRSFRLSLSISAVRRRENAGRAGLSHAAPSRSTPRHRGRPACAAARMANHSKNRKRKRLPLRNMVRAARILTPSPPSTVLSWPSGRRASKIHEDKYTTSNERSESACVA